MAGLERFDNFLITIVNETGGVEGLLHSLFSFLYRRTDFFYEMMPGEKMGFLPGEAERMVRLDVMRLRRSSSNIRVSTSRSIHLKTRKRFKRNLKS